MSLQGRRVLVTRTASQGGRLAKALRAKGADTVLLPLFRTAPPSDAARLEAALRRIGESDWVVFTSPNGVEATLERLPAQALGGRRLAAVGGRTAARLREAGLSAALCPDGGGAADLLRAFEAHTLGGVRMLLLRAEEAADDLPLALRRQGAVVEDVPAYRMEAVTPPGLPAVDRALRQGGIHWIALMSGGAARRLAALLPSGSYREVPSAVIGPVTDGEARRLGYRVAAMAEVPSVEGLVSAMENAGEETGR